MGTYSWYQAIPEQSRLLARLRTDRQFCTLYTRLMVLEAARFTDTLDPDR